MRIQQGTADSTVFKAFTDPLVDDYRKRGNPVTYRTYEGVDHGAIVTNRGLVADATRYIRKRLGGAERAAPRRISVYIREPKV